MTPYAELLEFNQPNPIRLEGFTRIRDAFPGLAEGGAGLYYDPERIVEFSGRWDYGEKNAAKLGEMSKQTRKVGKKVTLGDGSAMIPTETEEVPIIRKYIDMGHESMLEMADATFFIECSRVVSHELVRHRVVSYQQESQRFVKYDEEDADDLFYTPPEVDGDETSAFDMESMYIAALETYKELRRRGVAPQIARYVFPNATRTRMIMKTNLREWRHICNLRMAKQAQPEMQVVMQQIYDQLVDIFPNVMYNTITDERAVR